MKIFMNLLKNPLFIIGSGILSIVALIALFGNVLTDYDAFTRVGLPYVGPSENALLGTNDMGKDMWAVLVAGLRSSLYVGLLAGSIATILGTLIGVYSGYKGGLIDNILTLVTNMFMTIPVFIILILISNSLESGRSLTLIAIMIGFMQWTWTARAVRSQAASLKTRDHVNLAKVNGFGTLNIVMNHVLPYIMSYVFMVFIIQLSSAIMTEAGLSIMGLGPYDSQSLGKILQDAITNEALTDGAWWAFVPAVVLLTIIQFSLYIINTSMEGVFNPRLRK
ncbi:MAG: ABC transporter permease [Fibrobacterales bacterium]